MRIVYNLALVLSIAWTKSASAQTLAGGHGAALQCSGGNAVIGACTSGRDIDCGNDSHRLFCSSDPLVAPDPDIDWKGVEVSDFGGQGAWLFCDEQEAIFARCASGRDEDCNIRGNDDDDHGIKCAPMAEDWFIRTRSDLRWVCSDHGDNGYCPQNYVAVASCASGEHNDCDWNGCSSRETYTGLQCREYAMLSNFVWDLDNPTETFEITIYSPSANPFIGSYREEVTFTSSRSGSVTRENELSTEINSSLETKITAGYSYPSFGGRSLSAEVVNENSITLTRSSRTFQQVVESYGDSTSTMRTIDIQAPENFEDRIRVVSYRLTRTTTVHGTAFLGIAGGTVTESVSMDLTTDQEGFLILRIGNFPGLETMTNEEVVLAYVRGELLGPGSDGQPLYREETEAPTTPPPTTSPTTSPTLEPTLDQNSTNPTSGPTQAPMPETTPLPTDDAASVDQNSTGTPSWPFPSPTEDEPSNPPTDLSSSAAFRDKSTIIGAMFFFSLIIVVVLVSL